MALIEVFPSQSNFQALSTDIVNNKIAGLTQVGAKVYLTDTKQTKIVNPDYTLSDASTVDFIGRSGAKAFKLKAQFTRPNNTTAYSSGQAITNSTTAPIVMSDDLATWGAVAGQAFQITNARVISRNGTSSPLTVNIWLFNKTFTATNDGSALAIDNTTSETGGIVIPCSNTYNNATNSRCVSDPSIWEGFLDSADTKLYFTLQSAGAYTPIANEVITVILEGVLL